MRLIKNCLENLLLITLIREKTASYNYKYIVQNMSLFIDEKKARSKRESSLF